MNNEIDGVDVCLKYKIIVDFKIHKIKIK